MKPSAPVTRTVRPPKTSPKSRRSVASVSSVQGEAWFGAFIVEGCPPGATESMPATRKSAVRSGVAVGATIALAGPLGRALTAHEVSAHVASRALPWLVAAGFVQLVAALAASALAARDSYEVAALGYSAGAVVALVVFAALHSHGEVSLAWALTANGVVTAAIPLAALGRMGVLPWMRPRGGSLGRLGRLATGAAVPIALQAMFVVAL